MKKDIFKYLLCPFCRQGNFILEQNQSFEEIEEGTIICSQCNRRFKIKQGIVFLYNLTPEAEKEKAASEREITKNRELLELQDEKWLLDFPNVRRMSNDSRAERIMRLISENTALGIKKFLNVSGKKILEIGAANCWVTAALAQNNYCVALDILTCLPKGLEAGRVFIKKRNIFFERVAADMINLPFKNSSFDYVIISSSLHHSSDIRKTLQQINGILKPGGCLVILNEPYSGLLGSKERKITELDKEEGFNEERYTIKEWEKMFKKEKFSLKLYLPENISSVVRFRGGCLKRVADVFKNRFLKRIILFFATQPIFKLFDGYFNALLTKNER